MPALLKNVEHFTIFHSPGLQAARPFLEPMPDGKIALLFRTCPFAKESGQEYIHEESAAAYLITGDPASWPAVPAKIPGGNGSGNSPALHPLGGSRFMFTDWRWTFHTEETKPRESFNDKFTGRWISYGGSFSSVATYENGALGFGSERKISVPENQNVFTGTSALLMPDGAYLVPCHQWEKNWFFENEIFLLRTADGGETWARHAVLDHRDKRYAPLHEAAIISTGPDTLTALIRTSNHFDYMLQTTSVDGGLTWPRPERTEVQGHPPTLLRLGADTIACIYAWPFKRREMRICLSRDNGKTWDTENTLALASGLPEGDFGFPSTIALPGGAFLTAYHAKDEQQEYRILGVKYELEV